MAKKETTPKPCAKNYDPKVKFEGSLEDMIKIATKPIHNKQKHTAGDELKKKMRLLNGEDIVRTSVNPNKKRERGTELKDIKAKKDIHSFYSITIFHILRG
jgi:hypothetical protein